MAKAPFDLAAYLGRIGYDGPHAPTLEVLRAIHALHPAAIPFENLSPLVGEPVPLDLDTLQAKLVTGGRGGYCYEHNRVLWAALEALGFAVTALAARVLWGAEPGAPAPHRSHMLLLVTLPDGPWIADVGFGGTVMTAPLKLEAGAVQQTPHERFRLLAEPDGDWRLEAELDGQWVSTIRFDLVPHLAVDYEPLNWFTASHPQSPFVSNLIAARVSGQGRLALFNSRYTVRRRGEPPMVRELPSMAALKAVLTEDFGLTLPAGIDRIAAKLDVQKL